MKQDMDARNIHFDEAVAVVQDSQMETSDSSLIIILMEEKERKR